MKRKVALVSAFGRGHFLAQSLAEKGLEVTIFDLSSQFRIPKSEWAGPFPFLKSLAFDDRAEDWFTRCEGLEPQPQGLVVVTNRGPLELRNQIVERTLAQRGLDVRLQQPIAFVPKNFKSGWLSQVEVAGWSAIDHNPAELERKSQNRILDLFCKCYALSEDFFEPRKLEGVEVVENIQIEDVVVGPNKRIEGLLIKKERSEMRPFDQVVWAMGSQQTNWICPVAAEKIFGSQERAPTYTWVSFEIEMQEDPSGSRHWPAHFVWIEDPAFPWSREHFVTVKTIKKTIGKSTGMSDGKLFSKPDGNSSSKTAQDSDGKDCKQIWFRWPSHLLYSSPQLTEMIHTICKNFQERFDVGPVQVTKFPLSITEASNVSGPALFQVYREGTLQKIIEKKGANLHFLNFEATASLALQDLLLLEMDLYRKISNWLEQDLAMEAKRLKNANPV